MTNIIAFDSKVKKGSETVGCVGKESDGGAELKQIVLGGNIQDGL